MDTTSPTHGVPTPGPALAPSDERPQDRFEVVEVLKEGQGIRTLLATDLLTGAPVVVKTAPLSSMAVGARMRLEHEAEVLARLRSPHLAGLLAFETADDLVCLVQPNVAGETLESRLRRGPLKVADALTVARGILGALAEAHGHGVLHRDVKPANVIVAGDAAIEQTTLIDFGLARSSRLHSSVRDIPVGTARYVSPEQAGLLDRSPDERSDLYSTGILLFECLTGRPPFEGASVGEILRQHLSTTPPEIRSLGISVPRALDEVVQRLLRKDPRDRYQSTPSVLADIEEIAAALASGVRDPAVVVGLRDRRRELTEPAFVGRDEELGALERELEHARAGRGGLVVVEGESGRGKTRLLDELAQRAAAAGMWVVTGHGVDQTARRPFQVLSGIAEAVVTASTAEPEVGRAVADGLDELAPAVADALPELRHVLGETGTPTGPESYGEMRTLDGLSRLLDALGSPERPALVILEDCQWGDGLTARLLAQWRTAEPGRHGRHVVVVVAFRSEEVAAASPMRALEPAVHVRLAPFGAGDVRALVESMAGAIPPAALALIEQLAAGNAFMASAVLRGLVESGALIDGTDGWTFEATRLSAVQSSHQAAAFLTRRLELLPKDALHLLSVAAVVGKEFNLEFAADLAAQTAYQAISAVDEARRRHMLWLDPESASAAFVHDKLREALLARLPEPERRQLHHQAALRIQASDPGRVFELAYHFDAAGEHAPALPYALAAAAQARAQHAPEIAEQQYGIAQRGAATADAATRRAVSEGLGDILMLLGRYDEAAIRFEAAQELAEGRLSQAQLEGKLGELAFKRGDITAGAETVERALRLLRQRLPRRRPALAAWLVWETIIQILHMLLPTLFVGRRNPEGAERQLLAIRLYSRLGYAYWFGKGTLHCAWAHFRELNLAERYGPTPELAQAYSNHGPAMTIIPLYGRGLDYVERSLAIRRSLGDVWGEGQSLNFRGIVLYCASRFEEAIETCQEAARLLGRMGDVWEMNMARLHVVYSQYRLGQLSAAVEGARQLHQAGVRLGDRQVAALSLAIWSKASFGQVPGELIQAELDRSSGDAHTEVDLLLAEGIRLRRERRSGEAARVFQRALQIVRAKGMRQEYVAPLPAWLATALRHDEEAAQGLTPARRRASLRGSRRSSRRACRINRFFRNSLPHAQREAALAAALRGRNRRARKLFDRSLAVARQQGARVEEVQTRLARARIGIELDWPGSKVELKAAARDLLALGAGFGDEPGLAETQNTGMPRLDTATLSLVDRFDTVLDAGRRIASALTREAVYVSLREAGSTLLRSQHCIVLKMDESDTDVTTVSGEMAGALDEIGRRLAAQALATGQTCSYSGEAPSAVESSSGGFDSAGPYSALCAPIFVRGRAQACLLATHHKVGGLFGATEEGLADYLTTLAGAALENAEGFAELKHRAFHDSLTNLPNRVLFRERVEHARARRQRDGAPLAVLFLDLDNFKVVNDSLGHAAGDELLVAVAARLKGCLRPGDSVARLSGDEFAILIESLSQASDAARVAERVMAALRAPFTVQGREFFVHASGGIAIDDAEYESADDLLRDADAAMYAAKGQGKGQFQVFEPALHAAVVARLETGAALQRAVADCDFLVHYQPIVELATGEVTGVEALVRWEHPEDGLVPPDRFIPMAEETGLIVPIGRWVLEESCRQAAEWHRQMPDRRPLHVAVNLSARQLQQPTLVDDVMAVLRETGLDPSQLSLEITESVLMKDPEAAAESLARLKALGVRLALDDFGTGYSSLSYLQRFPIDVLKIDKCFVDDIGTGNADLSLAHAILNLGRTLGLQVVAEGIERLDQWDTLVNLHCDFGQGYLFSRPVPADQIVELLHAAPIRQDEFQAV